MRKQWKKRMKRKLMRIRRRIGRRGWRWIRLKEYYFITVSLNFVFSVGSLEIDFDNGNDNGIAFI